LASVLRRLRVLVIVLLVIALLMFAVDQSAEAIRVLVQNLMSDDRDVPLPGGLLLAAATFSVTAFSYGFVALSTRRDNEPNPQVGARIWSIRLLILSGLVLSMWIILARALRNARLPDDSPLSSSLGWLSLYVLIIGVPICWQLFNVGEFVSFRLFHLTAFIPRHATFRWMAAPTAIAFVALWPLQTSPVPTVVLWWSTIALVVLGWLGIASTRTRIPFVALAVLWPISLSISNLNDHHVIRTASGEAACPDAREAYQDWLRGLAPDGSGRVPVFIVAAEGGGIRAAVMTAMVLDELRVRYPTFDDHLFAILGVSGGSVGAASFAAALRTDQPPQHPKDATVNLNQWQAALHADLLAPTVKSLLTTDLATRYVPTSIADLSMLDRNRALEAAWERSWKAATGEDGLARLSFADVAPSADRRAPRLILLTTAVADGEPMAISHVCQIGLKTLAELRPKLDVPLTTAAVMSARFPGVSTAARLPGEQPGTGYVDGGYFENSGITAALRLIRAITRVAPAMPRPPRPVGTNPAPAAVMRPATITVIRIENGDVDPQDVSVPKFSEVQGPVSALYGTRGARAYEAVQNLEESISAAAQCGNTATCTPLHQVEFKLFGPATIPLGWQLSSRARMEIADQVMGIRNCPAFASVGAALGTASPPCSLSGND
jgi:hypothetical protein